MIEKLIRARRAGTPLVAITTSDPRMTINSIVVGLAKASAAVNGPIFEWEAIGGLRAVNDAAKQWQRQNTDALGKDTTNGVMVLKGALGLPPSAMLFVHNAQFNLQYTSNGPWRQAVWNLRDPFKRDMRMLVLLAPTISFPPDLANDVYTIDEPLPSLAELEDITLKAWKAGLKGLNLKAEMDPVLLQKVVSAVCGLSSFAAEQVIYMSISGKPGADGKPESLNINLDELWDRKRRMIEGTPGLKVWRGTETFDNIAGLSNVKSYLTRILTGPFPPRCIGFLDEGEKMFAGVSSDTSGVTQELLGAFLSYVEDSNSDGLLLVGVPGAGKSALAKASGRMADVPVVSVNVSDMKAAYVGDSQSNIRSALKVISSVSQGSCFFIMTCNKLANLPPELRRRFPTLFFMDIPNAESRKLIWPIHLAAYGLPLDSRLPADEEWTGADIRNCCKTASKIGSDLLEAAQYVTPIGVTSADLIQAMRADAHNKYLDASKPGLYCSDNQAVGDNIGRALSVAMEDEGEMENPDAL